MAASLRDPCRIQITLQHNSLKTRIDPKLATTIRELSVVQLQARRPHVVRGQDFYGLRAFSVLIVVRMLQ